MSENDLISSFFLGEAILVIGMVFFLDLKVRLLASGKSVGCKILVKVFPEVKVAGV